MNDIRERMFGTPRADPTWNRFAAKFKDRDECCGFYYAGMCRGASPTLIAKATGINYRTIVKLLNKNEANYASIKIEFRERGADEFGDKYYTEEIAARLSAAAGAGTTAAENTGGTHTE